MVIGSDTTEQAQRARPAEHGSLLAGVALAVIAWTLLLTLGYGLGAFFGRAAANPDAAAPELDRLRCLETAAESVTVPGEVVRLQIDGDVYLLQRMSELIYPRLGLTADETAPLLVVRPVSSPPAGSVCGDVEVLIQRNG